MLSGNCQAAEPGPLFGVVDAGIAVIHDDANIDPNYGQQPKIVGFFPSFLMHLI